MSDTSALVTLDQVVEGLLGLTGRPETQYIKMKELAIRCYSELNITTLPSATRIDKFEMDFNNVVSLPSCIIQVDSVYVPVNGQLWPLTKNQRIDPTDVDGEDITAQTGVGLASRGGNNMEGYYYYDRPNRRIIIRNMERSEVIIKFTSSGTSLTGKTYIPKEARAAIEFYVLWQLELFAMGKAYNKALLYKEEFERQKAILRGMRFNLDEFLDVIYSTMTSSFYRGNV